MNLYLLPAVFTASRDFVDIYAVNKLPQQRCCELIHLHKFPNGGNEFFLAELHFIHIRQAFTVCGNLLFQFQPFRFILLLKSHKHFVAQLARNIILIALDTQLRHLFTSGKTLLQFALHMLSLFENIGIGFVCKKCLKAILVIAKVFG